MELELGLLLRVGCWTGVLSASTGGTGESSAVSESLPRADRSRRLGVIPFARGVASAFSLSWSWASLIGVSIFSVARREVAGLLTVDCLPDVATRAFLAFAALRRALFERLLRGLGLRDCISGGDDGGSPPKSAGRWLDMSASEFMAGVGSLVPGVGDEPMNPSSFSVGARVGVRGRLVSDSPCSLRT